VKKARTSFAAAALLGLTCAATPAALAAVPGGRGPSNCQGYDVSHYQAAYSPSSSGPFGDVVSADAQIGVLVGYVHSASSCV
jgi:hypothetical protein